MNAIGVSLVLLVGTGSLWSTETDSQLLSNLLDSRAILRQHAEQARLRFLDGSAEQRAAITQWEKAHRAELDASARQIQAISDRQPKPEMSEVAEVEIPPFASAELEELIVQSAEFHNLRVRDERTRDALAATTVARRQRFSVAPQDLSTELETKAQVIQELAQQVSQASAPALGQDKILPLLPDATAVDRLLHRLRELRQIAIENEAAKGSIPIAEWAQVFLAHQQEVAAVRAQLEAVLQAQSQ